MSSKLRCWTTGCLLVLISLAVPGGGWATTPESVMIPVPSSAQIMSRQHTVEPSEGVDAAPAHLLRRGGVQLSVNYFKEQAPSHEGRDGVSASFRSRLLQLGLFDDRTFYVMVEGESVDQAGSLTLYGRLEGRPLATVSMVITKQKYVITLQDMERSLFYRVVGDGSSGVGEVSEIDLTLLPPRQYAPPLIPPAE